MEIVFVRQQQVMQMIHMYLVSVCSKLERDRKHESCFPHPPTTSGLTMDRIKTLETDIYSILSVIKTDLLYWQLVCTLLINLGLGVEVLPTITFWP